MRQKIRFGPEYQVPFSTAAKEAAGGKLLVGAVGGLASGTVARDILESNRADVVFVGRQFQKNPGQVWAMADEIGVQLHHANQIGWGFSGRGGVKILGSAK
jgi:2,4-dienoyl-CoA reductase-like NADH-dependent reductase (Old Yellow Enzyme family)